MSLSKPVLTESTRPSQQAGFNFNWIEVYIVPVTISLMEAQPFVLALRFGSLVFSGRSDSFLLTEGSLILLVLSLYWWAMLVRQIIRPRFGEKWAALLNLPGLPIAFVVIGGTHPALLANIPQIVFAGALSSWLWRRSIVRMEKGLQEEQVSTPLQIGLFVLLAMLFLAVLYPQSVFKPLLDELVYALPVFFVSGLFALSFSHLGLLTQEYRRRAPANSQAEPARVWGGVLVCLWAGTMGLMLILQVFAFGPLVSVLSGLVSAVSAFFNWLLSLMPSHPKLPTHHKNFPPPAGASEPYQPSPSQPIQNPGSAVMQLLLAIVLVLLVIFVLVLLLLLVRALLRKRGSAHHPDEEEVRENVPVRATLRARRNRRQRPPKVEREPVDPTSARARYRELLQAMAQPGIDLGRWPSESPGEYQTRLLTEIKAASGDETWQGNTPTEAIILDELTHAYIRERYGGKSIDHSKRAYLGKWTPWLVKRLKQTVASD